MTVILDNGQRFRITKIMGVVGGRPRPDAPLVGDIAIYFEPCAQSSVFNRGWWWVNAGGNSDYFLKDEVSMEQKEKRLLQLMAVGSSNRWYRYTGKNDRHNADLIPRKGE